jgi:tripartite-type tricarboxylate transporter receptor subunit TctC
MALFLAHLEHVQETVVLSLRACYALAGVILIGAAAGARAEQYPVRSIRVISPFPAGSAADTVSRVVLNDVSQRIGQAMVIEARPGAGGASGFAAAAKAAPDGYTTAVSSSSMGSEMVLHRNLPYDPVRDFAYVALFGTQPNILVVNAQSGINSVADLVAAAKAKPGTLTFASAGIGSGSHMAGERLRLAAGLDVRHVPFREGGLTEVMAGRIDYYFIPAAAAAAALGSDKLKVLAVSTAKRIPLLPDVPSIVEAGYPRAEYVFWNGLAVPAKTQGSVIDILHQQIEKTLQDPDIQEKLKKLGVQPELMSSAQFDKFAKDDFVATVQLAKDAHIEPTD